MSAENIAKALQILHPKGHAWNIPNGDYRKLLDGLAEEYNRIKLETEKILNESYPPEVINLIEEWFNAYNIFYDSTYSLEEARNIITERWTAVGGQAIEYLQGQIDKAGLTGVTVAEIVPPVGEDGSLVGEAVVGDAVCWFPKDAITGDWFFFFYVLGVVDNESQLNRLTALIGRIFPTHLEPLNYVSIFGFEQQTSSFGVSPILGVAYGGGLWVAVGDVGKLATSPDGETWTQRTSSFGTDAIRKVAYGNGLWVAVGGSGKLATSPDGITWTQRASGFALSNIYDIDYNGNDLWVAVGATGKLATSPDGIIWTHRAPGFGNSIIYGIKHNGNDLWVAVTESGKLATSLDGITWTLRTSSFGSTDIYGVSYGNGLWVAVGGSGKLATSPDGETWTQRTSSFGSTTINSVAYGNGLWVAVGSSGKLATSSGGETWTQRTSSFGSTAIIDIAHGDSLWIAVGFSGKLAISPG